MEIVRQIDDVDFGIMEKMNGDSTMVKVKTCHGTILMVKGLVEGEPDTLLPFGYRVDKMMHIQVLDEPREGKDLFTSFDMALYAKQNFDICRLHH